MTKESKDNSRRTCVIMIGAFPPPTHGMANVNAAVRDRFLSAGAIPIIINISPRTLDRSLLKRFERIPIILRGLIKFLRLSHNEKIAFYMSVSGGVGQLYEILFLFFARLRKMRVYLHHHSFAYLDSPKLMTTLLTKMAGESAKHIALSPGMAARLQECYPNVRHTVSISNAVLLINQAPVKSPHRTTLSTIGFISNLSREKGVFDFLNLAEKCKKQGISLHVKLAGPFQDKDTKEQVHDLLATLTSAEYIGPVYNKQKDDFFNSIDAFIFPTSYANEAEPLVIHEALQHAVPVIAYGRGAIPEMITGKEGLIVNPNGAFVPVAMGQIKEWVKSPKIFQAASLAAQQKFLEIYEANETRWSVLLHEILGRVSLRP